DHVREDREPTGRHEARVALQVDDRPIAAGAADAEAVLRRRVEDRVEVALERDLRDLEPVDRRERDVAEALDLVVLGVRELRDLQRAVVELDRLVQREEVVADLPVRARVVDLGDGVEGIELGVRAPGRHEGAGERQAEEGSGMCHRAGSRGATWAPNYSLWVLPGPATSIAATPRRSNTRVTSSRDV